jgi:hypothetical protein
MKGQILFIILLLVLILLGYFVIIIGLSTLVSFNIEEDYLNFVKLRSLTYSGIWLAFQWIKNSTSSLPATTKNLPSGSVTYAVSVLSETLREINVTSTLNIIPTTTMRYKGIATIDTSTLDVVDIEGFIY